MSYVFTATRIPKTLAGFVLGCCLVFTSTGVQSATANSATLQWTANSESDLAGYRAYQGTTSGLYGLAVDVGNTTIYTAQNLQAGVRYYFAITAFDNSGNESPPSIEVSHQTSAPSSDTNQPGITSPVSGSTLKTSSVTFEWNQGVGSSEYYLGVGTSLASVANFPWGDIFHGSTGANTSQVVSGIPLTGTPVFVRLWYKTGGSWKYRDVNYTGS